MVVVALVYQVAWICPLPESASGAVFRDFKMDKTLEYDVAIIGGGPAGSTSGTLLKKYKSDIRVGIFEREVFPRDHVGESQLPCIVPVLDEMGCWDKIEAAN